MRYLKLFEGFNKEIIHDSENKQPFDRLSGDDILTNFIEEVDSGSWKVNINYDVNDDLNLKQKMGHLQTITRNVRTVNLFNRDSLNPDADFIFALIEINHPKDRVKSTMFDFDNYIKQVMIHRLKRFYNNWDVNIFMGVINIDWMNDPLYKLFIVIQDNKHDNVKPVDKLNESYDEIETIKDYFYELDEHKDDKIPIKVNVVKHKVNTKKGIDPSNNKQMFAPTYNIFGTDGFKIVILFDMYDQVYVKNSTETAIKRLKRDYNIHYNQVSKIGNGYNAKEIPVYGTDRVSYVNDPIWKQTITISPKKVDESFIEDLDDFIDISLENDNIFVSRYDVRFDLLRKKVVGEGDYYSKYSKNKIQCYHGRLSNADFIGKYETIVDAKQIYIDTKESLLDEFKKFNRLINLYPNILIYGRFIISHHKDDGYQYNRYELIFINSDDYIKESKSFLSRISEFVDDVKDDIDIDLGDKVAEYDETVFDVRNSIDLYTSGKYRLIYGPDINDYKKKHDIVDSLSINIYGDLKDHYKADDEVLKLFRRLIKKYPNILIYKSDRISDAMTGRTSDSAPLRIIIVNKEVMKYIKKFENYVQETNLLIVDVQRSFRSFFTELYLYKLNKLAESYTNVYQIFDNHVDGKNVDKDYLYDENPDLPVNGDLYEFPNQKELVEKRYNYDVDADFYKKILDEKTYKIIKDKETKGLLTKGEMYNTTEGTIIIYIGNNHQWMHLGKKLIRLLKSLSGKQVTMVGGSQDECFLDVETAAISMGVLVKRDIGYIYTGSYCPIK